MENMPYIIISICGLILFIIGVVVIKKRQIEESKYYDTAYQMLKEEYLTQALKIDRQINSQPTQKKMIYLKLCHEKSAQGYVFNPKQDITIGREKENNSLWLSCPMVSMRHCRIFQSGEEVYLQDLYSSNGTYVKKGLKKYYLSPGMGIVLKTKDKIIIGDTELQIIIFDLQMM